MFDATPDVKYKQTQEDIYFKVFCSMFAYELDHLTGELIIIFVLSYVYPIYPLTSV